jgi:hypothetical protein
MHCTNDKFIDLLRALLASVQLGTGTVFLTQKRGALSAPPG